MKETITKKSKTRLLRIFCGVSVFFAAVAFSACDTAMEASSHEHTFATEWSKDATDHWYAATCDHTEEVKDKAAHSYGDDNVCDACGYEKTSGEEGHSHTFATEWSKDATNHWHAATCDHTDEVEDKAAHDFGKDLECDACGYKADPGPIDAATWKAKFNAVPSQKATVVMDGSVSETCGNIIRVQEDGTQTTYMVLDETDGTVVMYTREAETDDWMITIPEANGETMAYLEMAFMMSSITEQFMVLDGTDKVSIADAYYLFRYNEAKEAYLATLNVVAVGEEEAETMPFVVQFKTGEITLVVGVGEAATTVTYGGNPFSLPDVYTGMSTAGTAQGPVDDTQWKAAIDGLTASIFTAITDGSSIKIDGNKMYWEVCEEAGGSVYGYAVFNSMSSITGYTRAPEADAPKSWIKVDQDDDGAFYTILNDERNMVESIIEQCLEIFEDGEIKHIKDARNVFTYDEDTGTYTAKVYARIPEMGYLTDVKVFAATTFSIKIEGEKAILSWALGMSEGLVYVIGGDPIVLPDAMTTEEYAAWYVENHMPDLEPDA